MLAASAAAEPMSTRRVYLGNGWHEAAVYDGDALAAEQVVQGPALVAYPFTTLTVRPGDVARVLPTGDLLVDVALA